MLICLIDTSGPTAGVALLKDGVICYEAVVFNRMTHSEAILPMTEEAYQKAGLELKDTDYFAVTAGPGSFTGVRIGVTTVKALAHALDRPCIPLSALEAMARGVMPFDGVVCPMQNARAGQVYAACFDGLTGQRLMEDAALPLDSFIDRAKGLADGRPLLLTGDGMTAYRESLSGYQNPGLIPAPAHCAYLRPAAAAALALARVDTAVSAHALLPVYLRPPQAVRQRNLVERGRDV